MTVNLNRLSHFVAVVECGSFTAAAERLGLAKAAVSHQVAQLEKELGTTLLVRTTRRLSPTATGQRFYERCALILRDADEAVGAVSAETEIPSGTLTLTAPLDYGAKVVTNAVAAYLAAYPAMRVELSLNDTVLDMIEKRLDLAIRAGWLVDSSERAKRIGTFQQHLVAAPAYAAKLGDITGSCKTSQKRTDGLTRKSTDSLITERSDSHELIRTRSAFLRSTVPIAGKRSARSAHGWNVD
jgi:DNA-binding transcriptional LysR family regulator